MQQIPLDESEELRTETLKQLREKMDEAKLVLPRTDDRFLLRFLRAEHHDVDKSYEKLAHFSDFFVNGPLDLQEKPITAVKLRHALMKGMFHWLPNQDVHDRSCLYQRPANFDWAALGLDLVRCFVVLAENFLEDERSSLNGLVVTVDVNGVGYSNYSPEYQGVFMKMMEKNYPIRVGQIFILRANFIFRSLFKLVKPLMGERNRSRLVMCPPNPWEHSTFADNFPRSTIPTLVGGEHELDQMAFVTRLIKAESEKLKLSAEATEEDTPLGVKLEDFGKLVIVTKVERDSLARQAGIAKYDRIVRINGARVKSAESVGTVGVGSISIVVMRSTRDVFKRPLTAKGHLKTN